MFTNSLSGKFIGVVLRQFGAAHRDLKVTGVNYSMRFKEDLQADPEDMAELGLALWVAFDVDPRLIEGVRTLQDLFNRLSEQLDLRQRNVAHA